MIPMIALPSTAVHSAAHGGFMMGVGALGFRRRPNLEELDNDADGRFAGAIEDADSTEVDLADLDALFNDALGG